MMKEQNDNIISVQIISIMLETPVSIITFWEKNNIRFRNMVQMLHTNREAQKCEMI